MTIKLKQVIHYEDTNSVEATWVRVVVEPTPFFVGADVYIPPKETEVTVRCHSYADVQMDMLEADLGDDLPDYVELIAKVRAGIKPVEPPPVIVPQTITNYQGKVTLDAFQLFDEVEAYMQQENTPRAAKLAWATGAFERNGSLVILFANKLGLTSEQVDQMFIYGYKVE